VSPFARWIRPAPAQALVLVVLALVASVAPADAGAVTTVSGELDTNAALTIDPAADPRTADVDLGSADSRVAFIQRMPVTKTVSTVPLGDFASAPSCTTPAS
jgi:hypothetical protein